MLRKLTDIKKRNEGFTIIEVLIVLAIAALILVIVLIAIPQLQRNQRNTARKDVGSRIATEISSYAGNNNGQLPVASVAAGNNNLGTPATTGFFNRYLGCTGATTCSTNINNPSTGKPYTPVAANVATAPTAAAYPPNTPTTTDDMGYYVGYVCDPAAPENVTTTGASGRNYALVIPLEGGARYCLDNH